MERVCHEGEWPTNVDAFETEIICYLGTVEGERKKNWKRLNLVADGKCLLSYEEMKAEPWNRSGRRRRWCLEPAEHLVTMMTMTWYADDCPSTTMWLLCSFSHWSIFRHDQTNSVPVRLTVSSTYGLLLISLVLLQCYC